MTTRIPEIRNLRPNSYNFRPMSKELNDSAFAMMMPFDKYYLMVLDVDGECVCSEAFQGHVPVRYKDNEYLEAAKEWGMSKLAEHEYDKAFDKAYFGVIKDRT